MSAEASHDELLVARLKKRKLRIKDEIARKSGDLRTPPPSIL
ncbi:MAG: YdcH family protein [Rhizomicrobium sp.]